VPVGFLIGLAISFLYFRGWALFELRSEPFFWPKWLLGGVYDVAACAAALLGFRFVASRTTGRQTLVKAAALLVIGLNWGNFELFRHIGQPFLPQALGILSLADAFSGYGAGLMFELVDPWHCVFVCLLPAGLVLFARREWAPIEWRLAFAGLAGLGVSLVATTLVLSSVCSNVREYPRTLTWNFYGHGAHHWLAFLVSGDGTDAASSIKVADLSSDERQKLRTIARDYFGEEAAQLEYTEQPLFRSSSSPRDGGAPSAPRVVQAAFSATDQGTVPRRKNVILIHLESFRAASFDGLGDVWTGVTPRLSALMKKGAYFTRAFTNNLPSDRSITSMLCSVPVPDAAISAMYRPRPKVRCLPQLLAEAGYRNARMSGIPSGFQKLGQFFAEYGVAETYGSRELDLAFPHPELGPVSESGYDPGKAYDERVLHAAKTWLGEHHRTRAAQPFFLMLETMTNHLPWELPTTSKRSMEPYHALDVGPAETGTQETALLHRTMRLTDDYVADFLDWLQKADGGKLAAETLVVLYSDHPPWFSEPNFRRYDDSIKESWIPLFVLGLEAPLNRAYSHPVSLFDVAPTVLDLAGVRAAHSFVGKNLFEERAKRWFTFSVPGEGRVYFASGERFTWADGRSARLRADMTLEPLAGHDDDATRWELVERFLLRNLVVERSLVPFEYHAFAH
jgi:arylsulfatase A-like enzyme